MLYVEELRLRLRQLASACETLASKEPNITATLPQCTSARTAIEN